ncbi:peptidase inhibitor family I36 protein [Streptomyces sp. NPDC006296]|uniref:peptidase inhibitor family I36 protein n=1 Tax=Streptomyces sp. NPDC006296 TaxID=3156746 RepID=UPI0033AF3138
MRVRLPAAVAVTAWATSAVLLSGAPAQAAESDCGSNQICLFQDYGYGGRMLNITRIGTCIENLKGWEFNDITSSVINNSPVTVRLYQDIGHGGKYVRLTPGEKIANLSSVTIYNNDGSWFGVNTFNDRTSSTC